MVVGRVRMSHNCSQDDLLLEATQEKSLEPMHLKYSPKDIQRTLRYMAEKTKNPMWLQPQTKTQGLQMMATREGAEPPCSLTHKPNPKSSNRPKAGATLPELLMECVIEFNHKDTVNHGDLWYTRITCEC